MLGNKKSPLKSDKTQTIRGHKRGVVGYSRKTALLEEAITQMNAGKYGRSSTALKELLALDPQNMEARRLFATLHLRLGSLIPARQAFDALINEAFQRQDYWLAESLLREYLAAGPRCVPFLEKLATLYQEKGDVLEAVTEYSKAVDILIEDPDPDNPDLASRLFAKIRDLAPASPVAIRLASCFDAQTGQLLAQPPRDSEQSIDGPSPGMPEERQGIQEHPEPGNGIMSGEVHDFQIADSTSLKDANRSDSTAPFPPVGVDLPASQGAVLDEVAAPAEPPLQEHAQTAGSASDASEETYTHEFGSPLSDLPRKDLSGQAVFGGSHSIDSSSVSAPEQSETPPMPDPTAPTGGSVATQEQDRVLAKTEPTVAFVASGSATISASVESVQTFDASISTAPSTADTYVIQSSQIKDISVPPVEHVETQPEIDPIALTDGSGADQEHDRWLVETKPAVSGEVNGSATVSASTESAQTPESSIGPTPSVPDTDVMPSFQTEEMSALPVEHVETQPETDPIALTDGSGVDQEHDGWLVETKPAVSGEVNGSATVSASTESAQTPESSIGPTPSVPDTDVMPSFQTEEMSAPPVEHVETDSIRQTGDSGATQEKNRWLAKTERGVSVEASGSPKVSASMEPAHAPESLENSAQSIADISRMSSDEISTPIDLKTETPVAESLEPKDSQSAPLHRQPAEPDSTKAVTEQLSGAHASSNPKPGSANEISEPWKQPGFSWESVFNSAWKFGNDQSANVSSPGQPAVEEAPPPTSAAAPLQEPVLENPVVEIPEREEAALPGDQTSSGSPIAPMPWDHVQESVISIPPPQADHQETEGFKLAVERSSDSVEPDSTSFVSESRAELSSPTDIPVQETQSFSIAHHPQMPVMASASEIAAADLEPTDVPTESAAAAAAPEQHSMGVSAIRMDEPSGSEARVATIPSPVFKDGSVEDDGGAREELLPPHVDSVLSTDDRAVTGDQNPVPGVTAAPPVDTSPSTWATLRKESSEIPTPPSIPKQEDIWESSPEIADPPHLIKETTEARAHERFLREETSEDTSVGTPPPIPEPVLEHEAWGKAGESVRFVERSHAAPLAPVPPAMSEHQDVSRATAAAVSAVDVLYESSRNVRATESREHAAGAKSGRKSSSALSRARIAIAGFISSCFSTTRALVVTCVGLVMLSGVCIMLGIGAIGLTWVIMEESPSPVFESLTTTPQRTLSDFKKNGYFLLLGIDAPVDQDPIQAGYDGKRDVHDGNLARACFGGSGSKALEGSNASTNVMRGWVRSRDPVGEFKAHQEAIKGWSAQHQPALNRYSQWQKLSFEDWGYGQTVGPPCAAMVFAHQIHVADGFLQGTDLGVDRLETDMEAWRIVLSQAKTLAVKMLALQAINDDIAIASGVLVRADFDGKHLGRISKFLRPLDQTELSMRWPMQSELVTASKTYETQLKAARAEEQSVYTMVASALPLPTQRRLNDYAEYYDASHKAAGEGRYGSLPKWKNYIHFPASGLSDYFTNPIENIVGLEPLAPWDLYNGFVVDTDAHLRLASLQAWLRRGSGESDLITRIVKAGQDVYDPYTGLPMLVNMNKGVLYSVGHDGKDQDADPQFDVVVEIPVGHSSAASPKSSLPSSKSK